MNSDITRREFLKLLGLCPLLAVSDSQRGLAVDPSSPNFLFLVFDTLSAKHISLFGYARDTTPNLARFAERATVFHRNYSGGNFTSSGTATLLTGLYPSNHRALQLYSTVTHEHASNNLFSLFHKEGYHTLNFSQNFLANILVSDFIDGVKEFIPPDALALRSLVFSDDWFPQDFGIARQAELHYFRNLGQFPNSLFLSALNEYLTRQVQPSLRVEHGDEFPRGVPQNHGLYFILRDFVNWGIDYFPSLPKPYMAYLHLMPPHAPYNPRKEFIGMFANQSINNSQKPSHFFSENRKQAYLDDGRKKYDEFIANVDFEFGRLIQSLEERGVLENTWVVFTSDHGESFERGIYQHNTPTLFEPVIRVPLLIRAPNQNDRMDIHTPTSNADILPTLLHHAGISIPESLDGRILPPWNATASERVLFAVEAKSNAKYGPLNIGTIAAINENSKLVHYFGYDGFESEYEYYNLDEDPDELNNIYSPSSPNVGELKVRIDAARRLE